MDNFRIRGVIMAESPQSLLIVTIRDDVARLHEHASEADKKLDAAALQIAVMDTHVTRMVKDQSETDTKIVTVEAKVDAVDKKVDKLLNKILGGMSVIGVVVTAIVELLRIWFH